MDHAQHAWAVGHHERSAAGTRDTIRNIGNALRKSPAQLGNMLANRFRRALADRPAFIVQPAHTRLRGKRNELGLMLGDFPPAQPVLLFRQDYNTAALRSLIRK